MNINSRKITVKRAKKKSIWYFLVLTWNVFVFLPIARHNSFSKLVSRGWQIFGGCNKTPFTLFHGRQCWAINILEKKEKNIVRSNKKFVKLTGCIFKLKWIPFFKGMFLLCKVGIPGFLSWLKMNWHYYCWWHHLMLKIRREYL